MAKREPQPLIPEEGLKAFVRAVIAVPKERADAAEAARPKRRRKKAAKASG